MGVRKPLGDITKLPKWAQDHIEDLSMEREAAMRTLNALTDNQTPSACWFEEWPCVGEGTGPALKRRYIQTDEVTMRLGDKQELTFRIRDSRIHVCSNFSALIIKPVCANVVEIYEEKR